MEAISALGAAASVIQFVDFGTRLLKQTKEMYDNGRHVSAKCLEIKDRLDRLGIALDPQSTNHIGWVHAPAIRMAAAEAFAVGQQLLDASNKIKGSKNLRALRTFRSALVAVMTEGKVQEIERRLDRLQHELTFEVAVDLRLRVENLSLEQSESFANLTERDQRNMQALVAALRDHEDIFQAVVGVQTERILSEQRAMHDVVVATIAQQHELVRAEIHAALTSPAAYLARAATAEHCDYVRFEEALLDRIGELDDTILRLQTEQNFAVRKALAAQACLLLVSIMCLLTCLRALQQASGMHPTYASNEYGECVFNQNRVVSAAG